MGMEVARFSNLKDLGFGNWIGIPVELGGQGTLVRLWGVHHYIANINSTVPAASLWGSALSSNPEHIGELAFGLDEFMRSPALYGTWLSPYRTIGTGSQSLSLHTGLVPLYGIVRPRRQIWVLYLVGSAGSDRQGIEIYYNDDVGRDKDLIDETNRKFGKYRRS